MHQNALMRWTLVAALVPLLAWPTAALACGFTMLPALEFGPYDPFTPQETRADTPISVSCASAQQPFTIAVAGATTGRQLSRPGGGGALNFVLTDHAGTPLGDGGAVLHGSVDAGMTGTVRLYGRIPAGQSVPPGSYGTSTISLQLWIDPP